jgi:glycine cleavage system transcriptional repressor
MSQTALIILAAGKDRPGIVDRISGLVYEAGCNLEDSRMGILGGEFSLMVLITGPSASLERVVAGLPRLERELDLLVKVKETLAGAGVRPGVTSCYPCRIEAVSIDHPGIVHKLTRILTDRNINVARLDTTRTFAPVSGTPMFSMELDAEVPQGTSLKQLRQDLERWAESENVDIELRVEH